MRGVEIAPDNRTAFVTLGPENSVLVVDLVERTVLAEHRVGTAPDGVDKLPVQVEQVERDERRRDLLHHALDVALVLKVDAALQPLERGPPFAHGHDLAIHDRVDAHETFVQLLELGIGSGHVVLVARHK